MKSVFKYYSNAKFLITGEYLVLDGALSFAVPLKYGQSLEVFETEEADLEWIALEEGKSWLQFSISRKELDAAVEDTQDEKGFLCFVLSKAKVLNPDFLEKMSYRVCTEIDFNRNWGLGSSSSLINNIAHWAGVNPFELHQMVSNGSGYDIACANYCKPVLFRKNGLHPMIYPVDFHPEFCKHLYFVYLGKKQNSSESVRQYCNENQTTKTQLEQISALSRDITKVCELSDFENILNTHENVVADLLDCEPVKAKQFSDFEGAIKSLGAWGGDFILVSSEKSRNEVQRYFNGKGLFTIFSWNEMILNSN